jgi:hypothetical protein
MDVRRLHVEVGTALVTAALGLAAVAGAVELGFGWEGGGPDAGYFPFWIGLILTAASLWNLVAAIRRERGESAAAAEPEAEPEEPFLRRDSLIRLAQFLGPMVAFVVVTIMLGIYVGSTLYIAWSVWRHGGHRVWVALGVGLVFAATLYLIFEVGFRVPLLKGPLEPLVGLY